MFIWSPEEEGQFQPGRASRWWLKQSLASLACELASLGSRLVCIPSQGCQSALCELLASTGATALFTNRLYDPITTVRDNELLARVAGQGVRCFMFNADLLYEPWEVLDQGGKPYSAFADFWARWMCEGCGAGWIKGSGLADRAATAGNRLAVSRSLANVVRAG